MPFGGRFKPVKISGLMGMKKCWKFNESKLRENLPKADQGDEVFFVCYLLFFLPAKRPDNDFVDTLLGEVQACDVVPPNS